MPLQVRPGVWRERDSNKRGERTGQGRGTGSLTLGKSADPWLCIKSGMSLGVPWDAFQGQDRWHQQRTWCFSKKDEVTPFEVSQSHGIWMVTFARGFATPAKRSTWLGCSEYALERSRAILQLLASFNHRTHNNHTTLQWWCWADFYLQLLLRSEEDSRELDRLEMGTSC